MFNGAHDTYLESRVLSANPLELVQMLYQGAMDAVRDARQNLAERKILERSRSISRAIAILTELLTALDRERGGEIAPRLASLYDYMQKRLIEANLQQIDAPLSEVLSLLTTLSEGWAGLKASDLPAASSSPWSPPLPPQPEANHAPVTSSEGFTYTSNAAEPPAAAASPWSQTLSPQPEANYARAAFSEGYEYTSNAAEPPAASASPWSQTLSLEPEANYARAAFSEGFAYTSNAAEPAAASPSPWSERLPPEPEANYAQVSEGYAYTSNAADPPAAATSRWSEPLPPEEEANYAQASWSL